MGGLSIVLRSNKQVTADLKSKLDATAGKLEVSESKLQASETQLQRTTASLDATKAELGVSGTSEKRWRPPFAKAARSATSATNRSSISSANSRLLPTTWGVALSCCFVKKTDLYGRWRAGLCARGAPLDVAFPLAWQDAVRAYLAPVAKRMAPNSAQAMAYQIARQRRAGVPQPVVLPVSPSQPHLPEYTPTPSGDL